MQFPGAADVDVEVVIVGLGPVGATLGNLLGAAGMRVLILEKAKAPYPLPRAVHIDDETMRVFQTAGCASSIAPTLHINPGMQFVDKDGGMLLDWPRPQIITQNGWYASYRMHQPDIEGCLNEGLNRFGTMTVHRGATVVHWLDEEEKITIRYSMDGTETEVRARYVVGCDGANSGTRRMIGVNKAVDAGMPREEAEAAAGQNWEDLGYNERWLVVDVMLNHPMPELGSHTRQTCDPDRALTYTRQPGDRRRWEIRLQDGETNEQVTDPAFVLSFLLERFGVTADDVTIERRAVYTFQSKVAVSWRCGRMLIAGDAAHLTPPFMGQGLCAGIRDVSNLAWKLLRCIKGGLSPESADRLLNSYETERRPHVREYIETAMRLGALMNTCQTAEQLKNTLQPQQHDAGAKMQSIKPPLGPGLGLDSPLRCLMCRQLQSGEERPGLDGGLDDVTGYGPLLIIDRTLYNDNAEWVQAKLEQLSAPQEEGGVGLAILDSTDPRVVGGAVRACLEENDVKGGALLVRPDRYLMGGATDKSGLEALVEAAAFA